MVWVGGPSRASRRGCGKDALAAQAVLVLGRSYIARESFCDGHFGTLMDHLPARELAGVLTIAAPPVLRPGSVRYWLEELINDQPDSDVSDPRIVRRESRRETPRVLWHVSLNHGASPTHREAAVAGRREQRLPLAQGHTALRGRFDTELAFEAQQDSRPAAGQRVN